MTILGWTSSLESRTAMKMKRKQKVAVLLLSVSTKLYTFFLQLQFRMLLLLFGVERGAPQTPPLHVAVVAQITPGLLNPSCPESSIAGNDNEGDDAGKLWHFHFTAPKKSPFKPGSGFHDICDFSRPGGSVGKPEQEIRLQDLQLRIYARLYPDHRVVLKEIRCTQDIPGDTSAGQGLAKLLNAPHGDRLYPLCFQADKSSDTLPKASGGAFKFGHRDRKGPPWKDDYSSLCEKGSSSCDAPGNATARSDSIAATPEGQLTLKAILEQLGHSANENRFKMGHGVWSMIYDEGLQLDIGSLRMFARSKMQRAREARGWRPKCSVTEKGWYWMEFITSDVTGVFGCWYGSIVGEDTAPQDTEDYHQRRTEGRSWERGGSSALQQEEKQTWGEGEGEEQMMVQNDLGSSTSLASAAEHQDISITRNNRRRSFRDLLRGTRSRSSQSPSHSQEHQLALISAREDGRRGARPQFHLRRPPRGGSRSSRAESTSTAGSAHMELQQHWPKVKEFGRLDVPRHQAQTEERARARTATMSTAKQKEIVDAINDAHLGWHAKLNPGLSSLPAPTRQGGARMTDARRSRKIRDAARGGVPDGAKTDATSAALPADFDWRDPTNKGHPHVIPEAPRQHCGNCYVIAAHQMLSARLRLQKLRELKSQRASEDEIATQLKHTPPFASGYALGCDQTNGGCPGGDAYLSVEWAHRHGLVPDIEECRPRGRDGWYGRNAPLKRVGDPAQSVVCKWIPHTCPKEKLVYRATDVGFVGGRAYVSDEDSIMRALYEKGPLVVGMSLDVGGKLWQAYQSYKGGIVGDPEELLNTLGDNDKPKNEKSWVPAGHNVLLVGWGVENGTKYWTFQNWWGSALPGQEEQSKEFLRKSSSSSFISWIKNHHSSDEDPPAAWGEADPYLTDSATGKPLRAGFARIVRGVDKNGFESSAVYADVEKLEQGAASETIHWLQDEGPSLHGASGAKDGYWEGKKDLGKTVPRTQGLQSCLPALRSCEKCNGPDNSRYEFAYPKIRTSFQWWFRLPPSSGVMACHLSDACRVVLDQCCPGQKGWTRTWSTCVARCEKRQGSNCWIKE